MPGIDSAALVWPLPMSGRQEGTDFSVEGRQDESLLTHFRVATPHYFQTLGIPLLRGRVFAEADGPGAPLVAVINETVARRFWPGEDPVGRRIRLKNAVREIVGVVGGVHHLSLEHDAGAEMYVPYAQYSVYSRPFLALRASGDFPGLPAAVRREIMAYDRDQPVEDLRLMDELIGLSAASRRFYAYLLVVFAVVALLLAAAGVYGITSYWVSQRSQEIGLRIALGARASDVYGHLLRRQLRWTLVGLAIGLPATWQLSRLMRNLLFGVEPADPLTLAAACIVLSIAGVAACLVPARRAAHLDPAVTLRTN
jgi:putative ABC transport system permease protein